MARNLRAPQTHYSQANSPLNSRRQAPLTPALRVTASVRAQRKASMRQDDLAAKQHLFAIAQEPIPAAARSIAAPQAAPLRRPQRITPSTVVRLDALSKTPITPQGAC